MTNNQPYLIRALHEWITDNGCTPYLYVNTSVAGLSLPTHLQAENPLILNASVNACRDLSLCNESISFQARFGGEVFNVYLPIESIVAVVARENGQGMTFQWESTDTKTENGSDNIGEPRTENEIKTNAETGTNTPTKTENTGQVSTDKKSGLKIIR